MSLISIHVEAIFLDFNSKVIYIALDVHDAKGINR